jgi:hypothetical protein
MGYYEITLLSFLENSFDYVGVAWENLYSYKNDAHLLLANGVKINLSEYIWSQSLNDNWFRIFQILEDNSIKVICVIWFDQCGKITRIEKK